MELDKFQEMAKDLEPNLNSLEAKIFVRGLYNDFRDQYNDIQSDVNGSIEFNEIFSNSVCSVESLNVIAMDNAIKLHTNNLIRTTLEEIEDIEEYNKTEVEPEDCMDIRKRHWELGR